jgi:hypothetical protein
MQETLNKPWRMIVDHLAATGDKARKVDGQEPGKRPEMFYTTSLSR